MGTCFGRYSCSCCNCLYFKPPCLSSTTRSNVMARQNSTLEFENFMYDCDLQEPSTLKLQPYPNHHQQPSISTVVRFDSQSVKLENFKLPVDYADKLFNDIHDKRRGESPLLDPILLNINESISSISGSTSISHHGDENVKTKNELIKSTNSRSVMMMMMGMKRQRRKEPINYYPKSGTKVNFTSDNSDNKVTVVSSSSSNVHENTQVSRSFVVDTKHDGNQTSSLNNYWDHEVGNDSLINGTGNDLEWDDYQDNLFFTDETDSLIQDIEDLTAKALKETGLN